MSYLGLELGFINFCAFLGLLSNNQHMTNHMAMLLGMVPFFFTNLSLVALVILIVLIYVFFVILFI